MTQPPTKQQPNSMPGGAERVPLKTWLWEETIDHLFPWGPGFWKQSSSIKAASIGLAVAVTIAWILVIAGRLNSGVVIAWWTGWSVYEVLCRSRCKPWVKEGPWWGRQRRLASMPDLIFYVATKNLLIGAGLFLVLHLLGIL